ncbi:MAG TPA: cytochrome P450 [Methylotenera sp.]|nr:cytochrome P450 [Methylotenera sp.]
MKLNIFDEELIRNPYPIYAQLHIEGSIHLGVAPIPEFPPCWYVINFQEAIKILRNPAFVHDRSKVNLAQPLSGFSGNALQFWQQIVEWPLFLDAPEHTDKRRLVASFFRENAIADLEQYTTDIANQLLDNLIALKSFDAMWDFSYPLTLAVICKILGCTPPDVKWFKTHTTALANALDFKTNSDYTPALAAVSALNEYISQQISLQKQAKGNNLFNHLINDGQFKEDDKALISLFLQVLFAGQETAADGIGNGLIALQENPQALKTISEDLLNINNLVSEVLRFDNPLQFSGIRTATLDYAVGDKIIKRGESVVIAFGACCHDPQRFTDPQKLDVERDLNGSDIVFGHGIHYCLGVHLAKLETRIAFEVLLKRLPKNWKISYIEKRKNIIFKGPRFLTIQLNSNDVSIK